MDEIIITDSSLRDGNHSVKHTISLKSIKKYWITNWWNVKYNLFLQYYSRD